MDLAQSVQSWFNQIDQKYINTIPWIQQQNQYCLNSQPAEFPIVTAVGSLVVCFAAFFLSAIVSPFLFPKYNTLRKDDKEKWNVKLVSALHAAFVFQGAVRAILAYTPTGNESDFQIYQCGYNSDLARWYEAITLGYMFYDFWVCIRAYGFTMTGIFPSLMIHHINILICFWIGLKFHMGFYFTLNFMTNEISQPFLHASWFFIKCKLPQKHPLNIINGLLLVLTFIGSRFFYNMYIFYLLVTQTPSWNPLVSLGIGSYAAIVHVAVNVYWCKQMVDQIMDMIKKAKQPKTTPQKKQE